MRRTLQFRMGAGLVCAALWLAAGVPVQAGTTTVDVLVVKTNILQNYASGTNTYAGHVKISGRTGLGTAPSTERLTVLGNVVRGRDSRWTKLPPGREHWHEWLLGST
jgi:hypothetical protein